MFRLGPYEYPSKDALKEKISHFLLSAKDGLITQPELVQKLHHLLYLHPRALEKIGAGVREFRVAANSQGSGKSFMVMRHDNTCERFSYRTCIDGQAVSHRARVVETFRFAIRDQRNAYRDSLTLPVQCALTGSQIIRRADLHIDHRIPFSVLLEQFRAGEGFQLASVAIRGNGERVEFEDLGLRERWCSFHHDNAALQPTCRTANIAKSDRAPDP
jgi:hypothetical protein